MTRRGVAIAVAIAVVVTALVIGGMAVARRLYPDPENPREYFAQHRGELEQVAAFVEEGTLADSPGEEYYGPYLPEELQHLSVTGRVSLRRDGFFVPRWTGIPDDAGGYWHMPTSPVGLDMYGLRCTDPLPLGDDWWSCGMVDDSPD